jgi:glycosyltransferase involved in cell wall biosynthesis
MGESGPMVEDWQRAGAQVEILGAGSGGVFSIANRLQESIQKHRPDGVIAWFGLVNLPQIIRVCNRAGVKLVVHAGNPAHTMSLWTNLRFWLMSKWWSAAGPLPVYACCSDYVSRSFESSLYLRQFPRVTIYNGIEMPTDPVHTPRAYDASRPFVIGMTARLSRIKDHETLIRAFALIVDRYPNARLELAGDGELRGDLGSLVEELSIADKVTFHGDVSEVYSVMRGWDLFAYATTEREGLGNALSEAMALGLPCVVTDVGPMREFKGQGDAICFVPAYNPGSLAESVNRLIPNLEKRLQMSSDGHDLSKRRFAAGAFATQYAALSVAPKSN